MVDVTVKPGGTTTGHNCMRTAPKSPGKRTCQSGVPPPVPFAEGLVYPATMPKPDPHRRVEPWRVR